MYAILIPAQTDYGHMQLLLVTAQTNYEYIYDIVIAQTDYGYIYVLLTDYGYMYDIVTAQTDYGHMYSYVLLATVQTYYRCTDACMSIDDNCSD